MFQLLILLLLDQEAETDVQQKQSIWFRCFFCFLRFVGISFCFCVFSVQWEWMRDTNWSWAATNSTIMVVTAVFKGTGWIWICLKVFGESVHFNTVQDVVMMQQSGRSWVWIFVWIFYLLHRCPQPTKCQTETHIQDHTVVWTWESNTNQKP